MSQNDSDKELDKKDGEESSLEEEIRKLKKMVEDTLMDVRILISELENPFQYLAKYASNLPEVEEPPPKEEKVVEKGDMDKDVVSGVSVEKKEESEEEEIRKPSSSVSKKRVIGKEEKYIERTLGGRVYRRGLRRYPRRRFEKQHIVYERALLVGDFLLKTFGKDSVHKMLHLFYMRKLISTHIYMIMLDIIENLNLESDFTFIENKITPEDYILALFLLRKIYDIEENEIFLVLLLALKKTYEKGGLPPTSIPGLLSELQKQEDVEGGDNNA